MDYANMRPADVQGASQPDQPGANPWWPDRAAQAHCAFSIGHAAPADRIDLHHRCGNAGTVIDMMTFADRRRIMLRPRSAEHLYRLTEGWACHAHILADGTRQITDVLTPGDIIAPTMFAHPRQGWETVACGTARIAILSPGFIRNPVPPAFQEIRERAREAELNLLRSRLASLGRRDAKARVAHFFAELHTRLDQRGLVTDGAFCCPLTQEQLADSLGLTSVHVNRTLQRLRTEGVMLINRPQVSILDLPRLREVAGFSARAGEYGSGADHAFV